MADEISQLLVRWSDGDEAAFEQLVPLVYDELRRMARSYLRRYGPAYSLQPTSLVHEAYLRLADQSRVSWQNRAHFFALAANLMRNLLVDHVRRQGALKRGGDRYQVSLTAADQFGERPEVDLLALDEALDRLTAINPQQSRVIELRFFGGLTIPETAEVLGVSHATVERSWSMARAWLFCELSGATDGEAPRE